MLLNKKCRYIFLFVFMFSFLLCSLIQVAAVVTTSFATDTSTTRHSISAASQGEPIFLTGSNTLLPLVRILSEAYMDASGATVVVSGGGTEHGLKSIRDQVGDIALISAEIDETTQAAFEKLGCYVRVIPLALDAVVPILHPKNPVLALTLLELRDIFSGRIQNWREVGGEDVPIHIFSHDGSSGTYEIWKNKVLGETRVIRPDAVILETSSMVEKVAEDEYAIGYITLSALSNKLKTIPVEGILPTKENIQNLTYPNSRVLALALCMDKEGTSPAKVEKLLNFFLFSSQAAQIFSELNFLPATNIR